MEHHHRLLRELGATDAAHLRRMLPGQKVLVVGVRASTQTPPVPSGKRVILTTLEDDFGLVDIAFFEDSHEACAHTFLMPRENSRDLRENSRDLIVRQSSSEPGGLLVS
ncbi:hypothetical protein J2X68_007853 [Streptomyces sp. 3330]|nr:hypothetical protein [Streptomyces sp. 3330]